MTNIDFSKSLSTTDKRTAENAHIKGLLAHHRWHAETQGIPWRNGLILQSGRDARAAMQVALAQFRMFRGPRAIWWKCANGWDQMNKRALIRALRLVQHHAQSCFETERRLSAELDQGLNLRTAEVSKAFASALAQIRK
jgi:hypothetical protein